MTLTIDQAMEAISGFDVTFVAHLKPNDGKLKEKAGE
jgi:hypothetical protein